MITRQRPTLNGQLMIREWLAYYIGRIMCRTMHRHTRIACGGREDHVPWHVPGPNGCGRYRAIR